MILRLSVFRYQRFCITKPKGPQISQEESGKSDSQQSDDNVKFEETIERVYKKYYSIKKIPSSHWVNGLYCPVYIQKEQTPYDKARKNFSFMVSFLPSTIFGAYWVMLGPFDIIHIGIASLFGVLLFQSIIKLQLIRSSLNRIHEATLQTSALYVHKNGYDWVAILNPTIQEELLERNKQQVELQSLKTSNHQIVVQFSLMNIVHARLPLREDQEHGETMRDFSDLYYNELQAVVKTRQNYERSMKFDVRQNVKQEYSDFLKPLINKQRIIFSLKEDKEKQGQENQDIEKQEL